MVDIIRRMTELSQLLGTVFQSLFWFMSVVPLVVIAFYLFQTRTFPWKLKFAYLWTLFCEVPGVMVRFFLSLLVVPVIAAPIMLLALIPISIFWLIGRLISGQWWTTVALFLVTASVVFLAFVFITIAVVWSFIWSWGPLVRSFATMLGWPFGMGRTVKQLGAYYASKRQREYYTRTIARIEAKATISFTYPSAYNLYVLERTDDIIFTIGRYLFVSETLLRADHFVIALADELYAYNSGHSRLTLALRRLAIDPSYLMARATRQFAPGNMIVAFTGGGRSDAYLMDIAIWIVTGALALAGGGIGIFASSWFYTTYAREVAEKGDAYAVHLGYKQELMDYFDRRRPIQIIWAIPFYFPPEPWTEKRHEKIEEMP